MPGQEIIQPPSDGDQSKHDISEYVNVLNRKVEELASRYTAALRASQMYKNELANIAVVAGKRDISDDEFRAWAKSRTTYLVRNGCREDLNHYPDIQG